MTDRKRLRRMPSWLAIPLAALVSFVVIFVVTGLVLSMIGSLIGLHVAIMLTLSLLVCIPLALYVFRQVYSYFRWKWVLDLGHLCLECDYDLTGNVSGACPECGTPVPESIRPPSVE